jgi:hypothetical protein
MGRSMRTCVKCGIDDINGVIHEHHKNGDHGDDRPENKMDLCANCHMSLHWKRWKLSDIGFEDVEIIRIKKDKNKDFDDDISQDIIFKLISGLVYYHSKSEFERKEHTYIIDGIFNILLEGGYAYEIREKCIAFIKSSEQHDLEKRQQLNLQYQEFIRGLNLPAEIKAEMGTI